MKKTVFLFVLILHSSLLLADQDSKNKIVVVLSGNEIASLDPSLMETDEGSYRIGYQIYDRLAILDEHQHYQPASIVQSMVSLRPNTKRFILKKNIHFHNKMLLEAKDVVFSLQRSLHSPLTKRFLSCIKEIHEHNRWTVDIITYGSSHHLLEYLAQVPASIISEKAYRANPQKFLIHPVGSGAFQLKNWKINHSLILERFNDNNTLKHLTNPVSPEKLIQTIEFLWLSHESERLLSIQAHKTDVIFNLNPQDALKLKTHPIPGVQLVQSLSMTYNNFGFNTQNFPFNNSKIRRQILSCLNPVLMTQAVYGQFATPLPLINTYSVHDPTLFYSSDTMLIDPILTHKTYTLLTLADLKRSTMASIIQEQLKQHGVILKIVESYWGNFIQQIQNRQFDFILFPESARFEFPLYFLQLMFDSSDDQENYFFYNPKSVHLFIQQLIHNNYPKKESQILSRLFQQIQKESPMIILNRPLQIMAIHQKLKHLILQRDGIIDFSRVTTL